MEAVGLQAPIRTHVNELLMPELRAPRHEPSLHGSQPCQPSSRTDDLFLGNKIHSIVPSTIEAVPVDSVQNSLHLDESQIPAQQVSLPIAPRESSDLKAGSAYTATARMHAQSHGTQCNGEIRTIAGGDTTERLAPKLSTDDVATAHNEEEHLSNQFVLLRAGSERFAQINSGSKSEPSELRAEQSQRTAEQPSMEQPSSQSLLNAPRQPKLKFLFWKRYKSSRSKPSSNATAAPTRSEQINASRVDSERPVSHNRLPETRGALSNEAAATARSTSPDPLSAYAVTVIITSPQVYRLDDGTYIGKLGVLSPPDELESSWSGKTRNRLVTDLRPVLAALPRSLSRDETIIEPELCMAGRVHSDPGQIRLWPSIWIRCGSKRCRDEVRQAVADLSYLRVYKVHFRLDAPRFACLLRIKSRGRPLSPSHVNLRPDYDVHDQPFRPIVQFPPQMIELPGQLDITRWPTHQSFSPVAQDLDPSYPSACGLKVEFAVSDGVTTHIATSTIGGLVQCNGATYALTTAHSIFELLSDYDRLQPQLKTYQDGDMSVLMTNLKVKITTRTIDSSENSGVRPEHMLNIRALGCGDRCLWPKSLGWPVPIMDSLQYNPTSNANDFALIEIGKSAMRFNTYQALAKEPKNALSQHAVRDISTALPGGPVSIVLTESEVRPGFLLESRAVFMDRLGVFETRKIHTAEKLEKGCSGAWVVRGSSLLGMIIAIYDNEAYAHMLPMQQVFGDIWEVYTHSGVGQTNLDIRLPPVDPRASHTEDV